MKTCFSKKNQMLMAVHKNLHQNVSNVPEICLTKSLMCKKTYILMMCLIGHGLSRQDDILTPSTAAGADLST